MHAQLLIADCLLADRGLMKSKRPYHDCCGRFRVGRRPRPGCSLRSGIGAVFYGGDLAEATMVQLASECESMGRNSSSTQAVPTTHSPCLPWVDSSRRGWRLHGGSDRWPRLRLAARDLKRFLPASSGPSTRTTHLDPHGAGRTCQRRVEASVGSNPEPSECSVRLFGGFEVRTPGGPVSDKAWGKRKARLLFAMLASRAREGRASGPVDRVPLARDGRTAGAEQLLRRMEFHEASPCARNGARGAVSVRRTRARRLPSRDRRGPH